MADLPEWLDVVAIAPGDSAAFTAMDPAAQAAILASAISQCAPSAWGARLNLGIVYLAAHLAKLGLMRYGMVTMERVGDLQRQYAAPIGLKGSLGMTVYGAEFSRLVKTIPTAIGACL